MNNGHDIYNQRRKQSFPDEEDSCSNDEKPISDSTHKRKTRTMPEFYTDGRIRRKISSPMEASTIRTETKSGSDKLLWWDECDGPDYPEDEFKKEFRMSKSTFEFICSELNSVIRDEKDVTIKQRVAVCIFRLAMGEPFRLVSKRFGLSIQTCRESVLEVCSAIRTVLMPKYLRWPDANSLRKTKQEFEAISCIPNVVGSMHTAHIPVSPPPAPSLAAYLNKNQTEKDGKTSYTLTVQGVVDHSGVFTDVCMGWPGSMTDDQVLQTSALHQRANGGFLNGVWVVGSKGYPLMDWVLVPYNQRGLTWTQHVFNEKISEIQRVAKEAFMRLKGRWCCLQKRSDFKLQDLSVVVGACCVLHNICEMRGDGFECECEWGSEFVVVEDDDEMVGEVDLRSVSSMEARDAIAHNLLHHAICY
ncbi:putative WRKY transcription factor 50-like [Hibiscus syriacus]|uniref:WRKY transcription factor 50-like n=1 Tax=Hibiscus syriacus TaxID=106335 RepID=A0A6A2X7K2_HIBSY|nr:protein ALP1-like [Hibiscus syriacus]KAE8658046.1 putative WRKY transcription factor 50-like [Hibiscus syriacus]